MQKLIIYNESLLVFCSFLLLSYPYCQAASGAVQCQMMDMTYPGVVPMHKVHDFAHTSFMLFWCLED